jgi:transcriptional regulator with XRE-family HTH domain
MGDSHGFDRRLRAARERRGLSQEDLAERTELHVTAIYRLETGSREPRLSTVLRLARGLDTTGSELIRGL